MGELTKREAEEGLQRRCNGLHNLRQAKASVRVISLSFIFLYLMSLCDGSFICLKIFKIGNFENLVNLNFFLTLESYTE